MEEHEEIQEKEPEIILKVDRVGIEGVRKRIVTQSPEGKLQFDTILDAYVDLPREQRGIHMSRNVEVFDEAIERARSERPASLEEVLFEICSNLLKKHEYANRAEVVGKTTYYLEEDFDDSEVYQVADVTMRITNERDGNDERRIAVTIPGMSVCPSAQRTFHESEETPLSKSPSHTQRADITIEARTKENFVRIEDLVKAARDAFSAPTVGLLKRMDEHKLIKRAFERPRFIEDLARHALHNIYHSLIEKDYPDDTVLLVDVTSFESIHPYNIYAQRITTLRELKEEEEKEKSRERESTC